jgi:hypothetical protein
MEAMNSHFQEGAYVKNVCANGGAEGKIPMSPRLKTPILQMLSEARLSV